MSRRKQSKPRQIKRKPSASFLALVRLVATFVVRVRADGLRTCRCLFWLLRRDRKFASVP